MGLDSLPFANIAHNKGRTAGLVALVALMSFIVLGGILVTTCLQNGLKSLEERLGADIIVAPAEAKSKSNLESVLLDGTPGYFYMDKSYYDKVASLEGVEKASPQYYLATVKAGCCSMPVQVIGYDPKTDFTITPWIARSYKDDLGREDVVTGSNITGSAGSTILLYGVECRIVARLDETGTSLDNAVFATNETLCDLIEGSRKQGISVLADYDPKQVISTVQLKIADGYSVSDIADSINLHARGVTAVQTKAMMSGVADGVAGVARMVSALIVILAIASFVALVIAFLVAGKQRAREFAILRVIGASRNRLVRVVLVEALVQSALGAAIGCILGLVVVIAFNSTFESVLGLPFLLPAMPAVCAWTAAVFIASLVAGSLASAYSAFRLSKADPGTNLREG